MNRQNTLSAEIGTTIERLIKETTFGSLLLVVQDSRVVQVERNEKFQFPAPRKSSANLLHRVPPSGQEALSELSAALKGLQFGQIVVKIQEGRAVQIDRTEKRRFPDLTGISGDGI
jgi:hypothetical protein